MARVTTKRREEIRKFVNRWDEYADLHRMDKIKVSPLLFYVSISMLKEMLGEEKK
jgi:hypothetical protein